MTGEWEGTGKQYMAAGHTHPLADDPLLQCVIGICTVLHGWLGQAVAYGHALEVDWWPLTQLCCLVDTVGHCRAIVTLQDATFFENTRHSYVVGNCQPCMVADSLTPAGSRCLCPIALTRTQLLFHALFHPQEAPLRAGYAHGAL